MTKCFLLVLLLWASACNVRSQTVTLIPQPASVVVQQGTFTLSKKTVLVVQDEGDRKAAEFFNKYLQQFYGFALDVINKESKNSIKLLTRKYIQAPDKEGYTLQVTANGITIEGVNYNSTFYGIQTLIQLLPVTGTAVKGKENISIPFVKIEDAPRFAYRGMHLDVSRHIFPLSFIKQYIDYLALHKFNFFHWHLTDDQGWRIEIKNYPLLTEVGGYRHGTIVGRFPGTSNDNIRYGGFYTQEEVKEIVQYAADRYITVVPEIEMPGHASAAIAAYPFLSCFPNQKTSIPGPLSEKSKAAEGKLVQETWGVFDDVFCAGNDTTFGFLQGVLDEVLALFPSRYIHVGGDESPKTHWEKCPRCQQRIKAEGLKDEHELQSYFIQRMEKYLNAKGRILIGWDEILEGGLAPNAVVMSWRGEAGGIAAAKEAHQVIMTPGSHVYFDHTQSQYEDSVVIGGYTPLEKVYSYEPVPKELTSEQAKYIMGAQANLWTEYIKNPRKVEYMVFPRMSALSEVLWSPADKRVWSAFEKKLPALYKRYDLWQANYSTAFYDMHATIAPTPNNRGVQLQLATKDKSSKLLYAVTGKHYPKNYTGPVVITENSEVVGMYINTRGIIDSTAISLFFNKATAKKITLVTPPSKSYEGDGAFTLVNGVHNTRGLGRSKDFLGFNNSNLEAIIDLGHPQKITQVVVHTFTSEGSWIHAPTGGEAWTSHDGKTFTKLQGNVTVESGEGGKSRLHVKIPALTARYVKVSVHRLPTIPAGKPGAGSNAWLFADEIEIN